MKGWKAKVLPLFFVPLILSGPAYGSQYKVENQDIPVIAKWKDGHGFEADGSLLYEGWAFDPENGDYVRFECGNVQGKADRILEADDYDELFTDTEQAAGTLAVRGNIIKYFSGSILVVVENVETHAERTCSLTVENEYRFNIRVPKGHYQIKAADAIWNNNHYKVSFNEESHEVEEGNTCLFEIDILPENAGRADGEVWECLKGDVSQADEAGASVSRFKEDDHDKTSDTLFLYWPEAFLIVVFFAAAYGFYRFWIGGK